MISTAERWIAGSVSGGCLERDVLRKGQYQTRNARAVLIEHDETSEERGGTGCLGQVELLLERAPEPGAGPHAACDPLLLAEQCLRDEVVALVATVFRSKREGVEPGDRLVQLPAERRASFDDRALERELWPALSAARAQAGAPDFTRGFVSADGSVEALIEVIAPPPHLFVFGAAHDSVALVSFAQAVGFSVSVCSEQALDRAARERFLGSERVLIGAAREAVAALDRCACPLAMVMAHHYERDRTAILALASSSARYIGVLGPAHRTRRMLEDLLATGALSLAAVESLNGTRLYAPAGLDLGSRTPAEVALSILAEIQSVLNATGAQCLRRKAHAIHG
jgi:xanthine/CO dehydrogenase XdhC/CoxF family maturation factor